MYTRASKMEERTRYAFAAGYKVQKNGEVIGLRGRLLKLQKHTDGYFCFCCAKPTHGKVLVHRLAALQWVGEVIFLPGVQVRHLDGDKTNNTRDNLWVGTHRENSMDRPEAERRAHAKKAARHLRKLTKEQREKLLEDRAAGATYKQLCAKYGLAKSTVSYVVNGKTYTAG